MLDVKGMISVDRPETQIWKDVPIIDKTFYLIKMDDLALHE